MTCAHVVLLAAALLQPPSATAPRQSVVRSGPLVRSERGGVVWSPTGDRLAYTESTYISTYLPRESRRTDVCVLDLRTLAWQMVTKDLPGADPAWSPDGAHLAYIELDPIAQGGGDLVVSELGGIERRRLTTGGGFLGPKWLQEPEGDRFLVKREVQSQGAWEAQVCLVTPGPRGQASTVSVLARWSLTGGEGPRAVILSHSGHEAFYVGRAKVEVGGAPRKSLVVGLLDLRPDGRWPSSPVQPVYFEPPPGAEWVDHIRWSSDGTRIAMTVGFAASSQPEVWVLDTTTRTFAKVLGSGSDGTYDLAEWADGDAALVTLYRPRPDPARPQPPELRIVPLADRRPKPLEPTWSSPFLLGPDCEIAPSPDGTILALAASGEIRFIELGTAADAAKVVSTDNMRRLRQALVDWALAAQWAEPLANGLVPPLLPDPTSARFRNAYSRIDTRRDDFWVALVRPAMEDAIGKKAFEALLRAPNDPDRRRETSYYMPEEAYGANVHYGLTGGDTIVLRERAGIHEGGYHIIRLNQTVEWVEEVPGA